MRVERIPSKEARPWILERHYAHRMPCVQYAFGLFDGNACCGVVTFGQMASPAPTRGVCGELWADSVLELNRLCVGTDRKNAASFLVANSMSMLSRPCILMSYADTAQGHVGYIYQATNWIYTGLSTKMRDPIKEGQENMHNRHAHERQSKTIGFVDRPRKHRYVFFVGNKRERREMRAALRYPVLPYPKGDTNRYDASAEIATQTTLF